MLLPELPLVISVRLLAAALFASCCYNLRKHSLTTKRIKSDKPSKTPQPAKGMR